MERDTLWGTCAGRLRLLGFNDGEFKQLEKRGKPSRNVAFISPYPGTVLKLLIHNGAYVQTGTPLLQNANLDKLTKRSLADPQGDFEFPLRAACRIRAQASFGSSEG